MIFRDDAIAEPTFAAAGLADSTLTSAAVVALSVGFGASPGDVGRAGLDGSVSVGVRSGLTESRWAGSGEVACEAVDAPVAAVAWLGVSVAVAPAIAFAPSVGR